MQIPKFIFITGYPLEHSASPAVHTAMYKKMKAGAVCLPLATEDVGTAVRMQRLVSAPLLIVTIPHKEVVMQHCDKLDASAKKVGAVNTVILCGKKLVGYNTDVDGVRHALSGQESAVRGHGVCVIGAGGAARSVAAAIRDMGGEIHVYNRTLSKAKKFTQDFGGTAHALRDIKNHGCQVLINTTDVGMWPDVKKSPVPASVFKKGMVVFDVIYNPEQTKFLQDAKKKGCRVMNGKSMFAAQAARQMELWTGKRVKVEGVMNIIQKTASLRVSRTIVR